MYRSALLILTLLGGLARAQSDSAPITVLEPNGGQTYRVGSSLGIRWETDGHVGGVAIEISVDGGKKWFGVFEGTVSVGGPGWTDTTWVIPEKLRDMRDTVSVVSDNCLLRIKNYVNAPQRDESDAPFTIKPKESQSDGCGTGAGLALFPPLAFRLAGARRKRTRRRRHHQS